MKVTNKTQEVKEVIVEEVKKEGTNMEIKEEVKEVIADTQAQDTGAQADEPTNADTQAQEAEQPVDDRKAKYIADLDKKLRLFPRHLTIGELIGYRLHGCETWLKGQRTPSHTANKAMEIIDSALQGIPCGVITLGLNTEDNTISTINGSSRIDDFIRFYLNEIGKKESQFKDLPKEVATKFLAHKLSIDWLQGTEKELIRDFKNLNNDIALTGGQKAFTNLVGTGAIDTVCMLNQHTVFAKMFSARQLQKQEQNNCLFLILANILDCYNAKIDKVTSELASKDLSTIDIEKLVYIFDKIESADVELTKFKFIHLAHLMYVGDCWKSKSLHHKFDVDAIDDTAIAVAIGVNYATSGTNSNDMNIDRIAKMAKKLYIHLTTAEPATPAKPQNDVLDPESL